MKRLLPVVFAFALVLTACGGADDAASVTTGGFGFQDEGGAPGTTYAATTTTAAFPPAPGEGDGEQGRPATDAETVATLTAAGLARMIVFTATLEVEVEDITVANAQVQTAIAGLGGILFGQETTTGDYPRSVLTIKVAPEDFDRALERLAGVGDLVSQTVFADDVTERVVDLQSRIATAEISVLRLRELIATAPGIEEVIALERELLQRETDLEVLRGQLRTLEDQVALATIVLVLFEPGPEVPEPAIEVVQTIAPGHDRGASCPGAEEFEIDEGAPMTVCFSVTNTGDTALSEIEVRDGGLDLDPDDVIVVSGDLAAPLAPGERLVLAYEVTAEYGSWVSPAITATAIDDDGDPIYYEIDVEVEAADLTVIEDTSLPGFTDALARAWDGMQWLFGVAVIVAGAAVPFLWVPLLLAGWWWLRRRRRHPDTPAD